MEQPLITAVTHTIQEARISLTGVPDTPGAAAHIFDALAQRNVNVDMIVQNTSADGRTDISFTVLRDDLRKTIDVCDEASPSLGATRVSSDDGIGRVSLVGAGMKSHPGVTARMFRTLADAGINIEMISTSSIRISCVIRAELVEDAVRRLHDAFELGVAP